MCRKIYGSVYHNLVKDLDPERVCVALKRLTKIYTDITDGLVPRSIRDMLLDPRNKSCDVRLSEAVLDSVSESVAESWSNAKDILGQAIADNRCSDVILDNIRTLGYDKHIGRVLCPFMIDKNKDQKDSVMNELMPLVLQVEHFNENGEIESVLDIVNSLVKYPPVSEQIICLLVRSIEEFFYLTGYYPRVSRDIGLVLLWEALKDEKDAIPAFRVSAFEENLGIVCSGGYFRTLMKNTDIEKPFNVKISGDKIVGDEAVIKYYYDTLFSKEGLNVIYSINGLDVSGYSSLLDFAEEEEAKEKEKEEDEMITNEKVNNENPINEESETKEKSKGIFDRCVDEMRERMSNVTEEEKGLFKKIAVGIGCVVSGIAIGWGLTRLYDEYVDTTEVINDDTFFGE